MTIELKQAAQQALDAFDAFGEDDSFESLFALSQKMEALSTAIQQAEAQQPPTPEPVGFTYQAEIAYAHATGGNGSFWRVPPDLDDESVPLYTHPAPSVPDDVVRNAISTVREHYRGTDWGKAAESICDAIGDAYDAGREWAHRLTFRRYDQ